PTTGALPRPPFFIPPPLPPPPPATAPAGAGPSSSRGSWPEGVRAMNSRLSRLGATSGVEEHYDAEPQQGARESSWRPPAQGRSLHASRRGGAELRGPPAPP